MEFSAPDTAARASAVLQQARLGSKQLKVLLLPHIEPSSIPSAASPLLIFVNKKSGGGYGEELYLSMSRLVNPHQVFSLGDGGPLPGLYVFRSIQKFRILICGGDGTFGWVLSVLDEAKRQMILQNPPSALLPLGTGNDLSRVLRWGAGYSSDENLLNYLMSVENAKVTLLDRWVVCVNEQELEPLSVCNKLKHLSHDDTDNCSGNQFDCGTDRQQPVRRTSVKDRLEVFESAALHRSNTDGNEFQHHKDRDGASIKRFSGSGSSQSSQTALEFSNTERNGQLSPQDEELSRSNDKEAVATAVPPLTSKDTERKLSLITDVPTNATSRFTTLPKIVMLNNYFGIGVDADIALGFHTAREEAPEKFSSRFHNKGVYVRLSMSKMFSKGSDGDLGRRVTMECDHKVIKIPDVEGIIVLNIGSWGSGADLWGSDRDERYLTPTFSDGLIEVVGVNGIMHMAQIQGGLRTGIRLSQCSQVKFTVKGPMPLQVDGEPWMQETDCCIVITRCSEQAAMLMKSKKSGKKAQPAQSSGVARAHRVKVTY
jgi:diacylglycerol kinase (ATP)